MLLAIIVLLALPTRLATQFAAFAGGLGFGAFIDELGKFITSDNDYFFQPTIGLIYLVFVGLYLTFRVLEGVTKPSQATNLVNALELTKEAALRDMDGSERERALQLLARCDQQDPLVGGLTTTLKSCQTAVREPGFVSRVKDAMVRFYERLIAWRWFGGLLIAAATVVALVGLGTAVAAVWINSPGEFSFNDWGSLLSAIVSGLLVLTGVLFYRRSRLRAYRLYDGAVLVGIFVGQFFAFLEQELAAIGTLFFLLICHGALRYLIDQEQAVRAETTVEDAGAQDDAGDDGSGQEGPGQEEATPAGA
jgi:hypothetical protein